MHAFSDSSADDCCCMAVFILLVDPSFGWLEQIYFGRIWNILFL